MEKLQFKVYLSGSEHDKCPEFTIALDDINYVTSTLPTHDTHCYTFDVEDLKEGDHTLSISFLNKSSYDTVLDVNGNIVNDLLLNIEKIEIDDIELGTLIWSHSAYEPVYPQEYLQTKIETPPVQVTNCVNLGWNGTWKLPFTSPFFIWLLENM